MKIKRNLISTLILLICSLLIPACSDGINIESKSESINVNRTPESTNANDGTESKSTNEKLAYIYQSEQAEVSDFDAAILLGWGKHGREWNVATANILRDYYDQGVSIEDYLTTSNEKLKELRAIVYKMKADSMLIQDTAINARLQITAELHEKGIAIYESLHNAVQSGDEEGQLKSASDLKTWGIKKTEFHRTIAERIAEEVGTNGMDTIKEMRNEVADALKGK